MWSESTRCSHIGYSLLTRCFVMLSRLRLMLSGRVSQILLVLPNLEEYVKLMSKPSFDVDYFAWPTPLSQFSAKQSNVPRSKVLSWRSSVISLQNSVPTSTQQNHPTYGRTPSDRRSIQCTARLVSTVSTAPSIAISMRSFTTCRMKIEGLFDKKISHRSSLHIVY